MCIGNFISKKCFKIIQELTRPPEKMILSGGLEATPWEFPRKLLEANRSLSQPFKIMVNTL